MYRGVDGTTVPRDKWFHPDPSLLPPPLSAEEEAEAEAQLAEIEAELKRASKEGTSKAERSACVPIVRSN